MLRTTVTLASEVVTIYRPKASTRDRWAASYRAREKLPAGANVVGRQGKPEWLLRSPESSDEELANQAGKARQQDGK